MNLLKNILFTACILLLNFQTNAQDIDATKNTFLGYSFNYKINKKLKLKAGQMFAFNQEAQGLKFTQFKLGLSRKWTKKISTDFYYKPMLFKGNTRDIWYQRLSAGVNFSGKLFSKPLKNTFIAEWHFPQLKKYQYRFIYELKYSFKNKILPLKTTPYIKGQLQYYLGGKPISYYDQDGETLMVKQSPNGLHRYRLIGGIRLRPIKRFYVSLYYIFQREFNTNFSENRQLNVLAQDGVRIKSPFNNYQVLGLSLSYSIRKKKKKRKKRK